MAFEENGARERVRRGRKVREGEEKVPPTNFCILFAELFPTRARQREGGHELSGARDDKLGHTTATTKVLSLPLDCYSLRDSLFSRSFVDPRDSTKRVKGETLEIWISGLSWFFRGVNLR